MRDIVMDSAGRQHGRASFRTGSRCCVKCRRRHGQRRCRPPAAGELSASSATRCCSCCRSAAGFPPVLVYLALAGAVAAALAARPRRIVALGIILAEDVIDGLHVGAAATAPALAVGTSRDLLAAAVVAAAGWRMLVPPTRSTAALGACAFGLGGVPGAHLVGLVEAAQRLGARWPGMAPGSAWPSLAILAGEAGLARRAGRAGRRRSACRPASSSAIVAARDDAGAGTARARDACTTCACPAARPSTTARCG